MKSNDQMIDLIEKLFDEKVLGLNEKIDRFDKKFDAKFEVLNKAIMGNGHKGIIDRLEDIESLRTRVVGGMVVLSFILVGVGIYIRGFFEAVYQHVMLTK